MWTNEIVAAALDALRMKHAYATHGMPAEALDRPLKRSDRRMAAGMLVISRAKVAAWLRKYPKAATNLDGLRSTYETGERLRRCWLAALQLAERAGSVGYGQETRAEEAFERLIKESQ